MTVVNPKSISGITSITTASGSDNLLTIHTSDASNTERFRIDSTGQLTLKNNTAAFNKIQRETATHFAGLAIQESDATQRMQLGVAGGLNNIASGATQHDVCLKSYANLLLATSQTERLRIESAGNVKIAQNLNVVGVTTTGSLVSSGAISGTTGTFTSHVSLGDSDELRFGDSNDLVIQHNGTDSIITDGGTGDLYIRGSDDIFIQNAAGDKTFATFNDGSTIQLYHNGVEKFSTQSYGIAVDGVVSFTKDTADDTTSTVQVNGAAMNSDDYNYIMSATNNSVNCLTMFINGSTRGSDGGNNGLTIRNDNGPMTVGLNGVTHSTTFYTGLAGSLDFSGTADGGGATSEQLDDYEEGTWTPALQFDVGSPTITYGTRSGTYVKVGRMVHLQYYMVVSSGADVNDYFARLTLPYTGIGVGHQDARVRQWNTAHSDWFLSLGGSAPVFFMSNAMGSGANYARGDDVNGHVLSGQYTLYVS